jgi:hypothetical protein
LTTLTDIFMASAPLPRGIRLNNPGCVERNRIQWQGAAYMQDDPRFIHFVAPEWGFRCAARILLHHYRTGMITVRELINNWAPPVENPTTAYVLDVSQRMGVQPDDVINLPRQLPDLLKAICWHENGQMPYSDAIIAYGIELEATPPAKPIPPAAAPIPTQPATPVPAPVAAPQPPIADPIVYQPNPMTAPAVDPPVIPPPPPPIVAIPWYKSPVMIGVAVSVISQAVVLFPKAALLLGLTSPAVITTTVESLFQLIAIGAAGFSAYKRTASPIQPLTMTKSGATVANQGAK